MLNNKQASNTNNNTTSTQQQQTTTPTHTQQTNYANEHQKHAQHTTSEQIRHELNKKKRIARSKHENQTETTNQTQKQQQQTATHANKPRTLA